MDIATPARVMTDLMSGERFRGFQQRRPGHERWELIAGVPVMMPPPTIIQNHIASNLVHLLNGALTGQSPPRIAVQRSGIELGTGDYRPEPDVVVLDAGYGVEQSFVHRCYLLAEVVSSSDHVQFPQSRRPWIEVKRDLYMQHTPCEAVVVIQQSWIEVHVDVRTGSGWQSETLVDADAKLELPSFGVHSRVGDLYAGTPLLPRVV
jgi:Uma2 family endonuclease